ncbi:MAG: shikimate dehydrogenase [Acidobacteria bacterium]|nr:shikimate dehydrogenase [Acidobacteriota bacterium]
MARRWNFRQELVFCFGHHLADNPTQYMLEKAFRHHGLNWRYVNFELGNERLAEAVRAVRVLGFRGGNCTMPCKVTVIPYLDRLGQSAGVMEAVNCVVVDGEELVGENTDGKGFLQSLREVTEPVGKRVTILGAGGAARAIAVETALAGASRITIVNRSPQRGKELVELLQTRTEAEAHFLPWKGDHAVSEDTEILINATSIGMHPDAGARIPLRTDTLTPGMVVADVIANPPQTRLLQDAAARGCTTLDGLGMLVNQGVISFRYWTGQDPDSPVMRAALEEVFAG